MNKITALHERQEQLLGNARLAAAARESEIRRLRDAAAASELDSGARGASAEQKLAELAKIRTVTPQEWANARRAAENAREAVGI